MSLESRARRPRWVPIAAAAGAVLVVTVGAVVVLGGRSSGRYDLPLNAVPGEPDTKTNSGPDRPDAAEHASAVALLEQLADKVAAQAGPLTLAPGNLLYVRGSNLPDGKASKESTDYTHELWLEVPGCIPVMIRRVDGTKGFTVPDPGDPRDSLAAEAAATRAQLAAEGPTLYHPTPEFLAALPTDPAALLTVLGEQFERSRGAWSTEHAIVDQLHQLFYLAGPLIPPAQKAAIYRAMATMGSVAATGQPRTLAGRTVVGVAQLERGQRTQLLFDPVTGDMVGSGGEAADSWFDLWRYGVVARAGELPR